MQSMHRQFGKFLKRSADDSQVSVLLKDFDNADQLLAKIVESSRAWRDSWTSILTYQSRLVQEFESFYCPIVGAADHSTGHTPAETPENIVTRTSRLNEEYETLRTDLVVEINNVDERMIRPANEAKESLQPLKKVIKKREDKKLDFERYQSRVDGALKKTKRSDRDNAALAKAETELTKATEEYNAADEHLRTHLPGILSAVFSLLPHLLAAQIEIQNTLLALYYTTLHTYCEEQQLPSPPPPMDVVIQTWEQDFLPTQREIESINCLAHGKSVRQPRSSDEHKNGSLLNGLGTRHQGSSASRKPSVSPNGHHRIPQIGGESRPRLNGSNSAPSIHSLSSNKPYSPPGVSTISETSDHTSHAPSSTLQPTVLRNAQRQASSPAVGIASMAAAAAKKKPPPPPPKPRSASSNHVFVTALYDFGGQAQGDLVFNEGDRIRVLKRTDSTDDWWEGELKGVKGTFPANYCS